MSFNGYKDIISEGDTVILYLTINQIYVVKAVRTVLNKKGNATVDNVYQTPYGALRCGDLIGERFGSRVILTKGWGYALQPTPELWTLTLPHRTQIIYTADISIIVLQLGLRPGSVVVESGTGSGSLSHALIRAVKPHGHLYTFDFHETRVELAKEEFSIHGLSEFVTVESRDVCTNGFGIESRADAVFLDLPHPWLAVPHVLRALKNTGGRLCSFSPCIEQVQKTCQALDELGFWNVETLEVVQTPYSVQTKTINVLDLEMVKREKDGSEDGKNKGKEVIKSVVAVPPKTYPGHTGYLTFATLSPIWARITNNSKEEGKEDFSTIT